MIKDNNKLENYEFVSEKGSKLLESQISSIRALDSKIGVLLGLTAVSFTILIGGIPKYYQSMFLNVCGSLLLFVSLILLAFAMKPVKHRIGINLINLIDKYRDIEKIKLYEKYMAAVRDSYKLNLLTIKIKGILLVLSLVFIIIGLLLVYISRILN